jgi:hypothetical protein
MTSSPCGADKKVFLFSRRGSQMNRVVTQSIENMSFPSAKLRVKLTDTPRENFQKNLIIEHQAAEKPAVGFN